MSPSRNRPSWPRPTGRSKAERRPLDHALGPCWTGAASESLRCNTSGSWPAGTLGPPPQEW
eukprot:16428868-Heterocapsa_arctica.AAC.1